MRAQPLVALAVSLVLACVTGVTEETIFRGELLPTLGQWASNNVGVAEGLPSTLAGWGLSTALFAALHVNPKGLLQGGVDAQACRMRPEGRP